MSLNDDLTAVQRCLGELDRALGRLERQLGSDGPELRRMRSDAGHLRDSFSLLRETQPPERPRPAMVTIPDTPYDASLWRDADEEGIGSRDRRAP
ncbi:hypothetical protein GCM10020221_29060 [Streptomyces thioluteus]|uniref:Uncharacterized protein n=1 Tax=Streptomyces thioluteus TaxID=66431 RepID=A0ABN3WXK5_STRTU|nr:hypothetical protein [Streptomyces sp. AV19]MBH1935622.1 hypothetical protein [Streptomyces sp. AV19]MDG4534509.1 hypothetical protein [Streptomyces sp. AV19]